MQDNITIARPYARAVFEQARQESRLEQWSSLLGVLTQIVREPQMRAILGSPKVTHGQLLELVSGIVGGQLSQSELNFIRILIHANRLVYASYILELFEKMHAEAEGRMEVDVISAYELDATQSDRISEAMGRRLGKKVSVSPSVDQSLIGGIIIRAGDSVIDASLRGRLTALHNNLIG